MEIFCPTPGFVLFKFCPSKWRSSSQTKVWGFFFFGKHSANVRWDLHIHGRTVRGRRKDLISGTAGKRRHLNPFFCPAHFKNIILIQVVSLYMPTSKSTSLCMSSSNFSLETIYQFSLWLMINYISFSTISDISIETILNLSLWLLITNTI